MVPWSQGTKATYKVQYVPYVQFFSTFASRASIFYDSLSYIDSLDKDEAHCNVEQNEKFSITDFFVFQGSHLCSPLPNPTNMWGWLLICRQLDRHIDHHMINISADVH